MKIKDSCEVSRHSPKIERKLIAGVLNHKLNLSPFEVWKENSYAIRNASHMMYLFMSVHTIFKTKMLLIHNYATFFFKRKTLRHFVSCPEVVNQK